MHWAGSEWDQPGRRKGQKEVGVPVSSVAGCYAYKRPPAEACGLWGPILGSQEPPDALKP